MTYPAFSPSRRFRRDTKQLVYMVILTGIVGVITGLGAAALSLFLHGVEHLAFGQAESVANPVVTDGTSWQRRLIAVTVTGIIVATCWYLLRRFGRPIVSVEQAAGGAKMPVFETIVNAFLQMAAAGGGASIGREGAPREIGAVVAERFSRILPADRETRRLLIAAAAGAGLSAIYHSPLAGAVFALEVVAGTLTPMAVLMALAASAIATVVSGVVVGSEPMYSVVPLSEGFANVSAAVLIGFAVGTLGWVFRQLEARSRIRQPRGWKLLIWMPLTYVGVGIAAIWFPTIMGNGRSAANDALNVDLALTTIVALIIIKAVAVLATLRSGTAGGSLTPGFAIGALSGLLMGQGLTFLFPDLPLSDFALLGAASFLAASMGAPLFAMLVIVEFTGQGSAAYLSLFLASATASVMARFLSTVKNRYQEAKAARDAGAQRSSAGQESEDYGSDLGDLRAP